VNGGDRRRVLVADDHPLIVRLLRRTFEDAGYAVAVETAANEVRQSVAREQVQLAIIDANMKPCERFHALRAVGKLDGEQRPAIIVLSGDDAPAVRQRALELGADAFMVKPWDPDDLLDVAQRLIGARCA
jgi:DNA-binding response OmpR family regulator